MSTEDPRPHAPWTTPGGGQGPNAWHRPPGVTPGPADVRDAHDTRPGAGPAFWSSPAGGHATAENRTASGPTGPGPDPRPGGGDRRRPGWAALVATAAGAAVLASLGTAGLTGAFEDEPAATPTATATTASTTSTGGAPPVVTSTTDDPDWANVAAAVRPSVVAIDVRTAAGAGAGSGVILDAEGHILTNDHVVGDAVDGGLVVTLSDGRMYEASIAGLDPATDLAVITLTDPPEDLAPATLGSSADVVVGDPVVAVGNPLGLSSTVTTGIVSALDRPVTTADAPQMPGRQGTTVTTNAIQVDAAINPGNSGGPLFDAVGRVIGITSSIASTSDSPGSIGLGFAIPVDLASHIADQLIEEGVAEHAYLGVFMSDGTARAGDAVRAGARVEGVEPGTPAEEAGLRPGDTIVGIDGDPVSGYESLTGYVRQYSSGEKVTLDVVRDGETVELGATLTTREDSA